MDSGYVKMGFNTQELLVQPTDIHVKDHSPSVLSLGNKAGEERAKQSISMFFSSPSNTDSDNLILTTEKESKSVLGKISG